MVGQKQKGLKDLMENLLQVYYNSHFSKPTSSRIRPLRSHTDRGPGLFLFVYYSKMHVPNFVKIR